MCDIDISTHIELIAMVNVGKYNTFHGSYGLWNLNFTIYYPVILQMTALSQHPSFQCPIRSTIMTAFLLQVVCTSLIEFYGVLVFFYTFAQLDKCKPGTQKQNDMHIIYTSELQYGSSTFESKVIRW